MISESVLLLIIEDTALQSSTLTLFWNGLSLTIEGISQKIVQYYRVVTGSRPLEFERSKVKQYAGLAKYGIKTPRTVVVTGSLFSLLLIS